jgi:uroporphyrinogen decarboxylase
MKILTGAERMFKTLQLQEPDRVPFYEPPNKIIKEKLLPGSSYYDAVQYFDLDAVSIDDRATPAWRMENIDASGKHFRNQWGTICRVTSETLPHPVEAAVKSEKDLDNWNPPDPDEPRRYEYLAELVKRYKGHKAVIAGFQDPFNVANEVRGAADHYMDFVRNPDFVDRLAGMIRDYYLKYIRNCIEIGADIIFITGDYATTKWPMLSNEHFAKHVIPVLRSLVDETKSLGAYALKHTDGNIWPIIDMIIDSGIDGLHPIDPLAGMDLGEVKEKYGHRVCLMGNVDCAYTLTWGTLEEVREEVKRCIRQAARGGGLICMSSNSIHSAVKPENYVEMVRAIHEYGKYPICI